jgi:ankyrin repeat protein
MKPASFKKLFFSMALTTFVACSGSGSSDSPAAAQPQAETPSSTQTQPDELVQQNYDIQVNSASCINPFPFVRDYQEELAQQIHFGNASCVKKILELGAKATKDVVEFGSRESIRPLQYAISDSSLFFAKSSLFSFAVVKVLVDAGADINEKNAMGMNLLHQAISNSSVYKDHPTLAGYLIQSGKIEINATNLAGHSALHLALNQKQNELAKYLVKFGADINQKTREGLTPLLLALQNKMEAFAASIVDQVESVEGIDAEENTALHLAIEQKFDDVALKLLARTKNVNQLTRNLETPFYKAVVQNSLALVKALIERQANVDLATSTQAPIHAALRNQVAEVVTLLISKVVQLEAKDSNSQTPLHLAVTLGTDSQVTQLLARGAHVDGKNNQSETALHLATKANFIQKMNLLIAAHANVNALSIEKKSPLYFATSKAAAEVLVKAQASLNLKDTSGASPLSNFVSKNNTEIALYLADSGSDIHWKDLKNKSLLDLSVESNNLTLASYFLQKKIDSNEVDANGESAIFAIQSNEMLNLLAANGADLNLNNKMNETVLTQKVGLYNASYASPEILSNIRRLLELGAVADMRDVAGNSLVMLTVKANPLRYPDGKYQRGDLAFDNSLLLDLLLKSNANVNSVNKIGDSAIHVVDTAQEIQLLGASQIDVNLKNRRGETALKINSRKLDDVQAELIANADKLKSLDEKLKAAEAAGNVQLANLLRRQIIDLNGTMDMQQNQKATLNAVVDVLLAMGAQ